MRPLLVLVLALLSPLPSLSSPPCEFTSPEGQYFDLSGMTKKSGPDFEKTVQVGSTIQFIYRVNVCGNTLTKCNNQEGSATESLKIPAGETCRVLGRLDGVKMVALKTAVTPSNPKGEGVTISYAGGDICDPVSRSTRTTTLNIECSTTEPSAGKLLEMRKDATCSTTFQMASKYACSDSKSSFGSIFLILFFVVALVYLVGGVVYNYKVAGKEGLEMLPNVEFWSELPSLVRDGIMFTKETVERKINENRGQQLP